MAKPKRERFWLWKIKSLQGRHSWIETGRRVFVVTPKHVVLKDSVFNPATASINELPGHVAKQPQFAQGGKWKSIGFNKLPYSGGQSLASLHCVNMLRTLYSGGKAVRKIWPSIRAALLIFMRQNYIYKVNIEARNFY